MGHETSQDVSHWRVPGYAGDLPRPKLDVAEAGEVELRAACGEYGECGVWGV